MKLYHTGKESVFFCTEKFIFAKGALEFMYRFMYNM